ncbi:type 1 glutamine amidotransferase [Vitreoscilla stercoraria]|uniref:Type 1 glutamine amidotransferase n=2 Tax=Vitreoscilla stercoraria TaxID=61 RepID=A0ABY4EB00_VITST|nr:MULTISPECIES: type 1 glutamine amidotransferase [Vitreoscilla]AUZ05659.2 hypothetical protein ADP71_22710 [Vitreoscilla sp. C1]UOO92933.1 type 1 glutamine amidotransferase [Vitreoscilla stercoraria]
MKTHIHIAVLEMGILPEALEEKHGHFFSMIQTWLGAAAQEAMVEISFQRFSICNRDDLPQAEAFDAYVISGSKHSVYEDLPWIHDSKLFLNELRHKNIPMFGICFGHQLMAEAFGGKVEKSSKGWGFGTDTYQFADGQSQEVLVVHQDQVVVLPETAHVIGQSAHCEYGALEYDFAAKSTQFHPEFNPALVQDLLLQYQDTVGIDQAQAALAHLPSACLNNQAFAQEVIAFFQTNLANLSCANRSQ